MSILTAILCLVEQFVNFVLAAIMAGVNLLVVGLADVITALLPLLPSLPAFPTISDSSWWAWLNWIVPLSSFAALAATLLTIFGTYFVLRIAFRWAKAL